MAEVEEPLIYFGKVMDSTTCYEHTPRDVARILKDRQYYYAVLEPGDATNYKLHLIYQDSQLFALRDGSKVVVTLIENWCVADSTQVLGRGNEWSEKLLAWWIGLVVDALLEESESASHG